MAPDAEECPELLSVAANEVARAGLVCCRSAPWSPTWRCSTSGRRGRHMRLRGLQAGVAVGQVREQTGFTCWSATTARSSCLRRRGARDLPGAARRLAPRRGPEGIEGGRTPGSPPPEANYEAVGETIGGHRFRQGAAASKAADARRTVSSAR